MTSKYTKSFGDNIENREAMKRFPKMGDEPTIKILPSRENTWSTIPADYSLDAESDILCRGAIYCMKIGEVEN